VQEHSGLGMPARLGQRRRAQAPESGRRAPEPTIPESIDLSLLWSDDTEVSCSEDVSVDVTDVLNERPRRWDC
jgi:hypothetical protein